jgi:hypothetical protein
MLRERAEQAVQAEVRRAPRFERFLRTRSATVVLAVMAVAALAGSVVAAWRGEWVDAAVRLVLAVAFAGWAVTRMQRRHAERTRAGM